MATVRLLADDELSPEAKAVFDDIRATRQTDFVNNFWRALAADPELLKLTWDRVQTVMAPGALDPLVKELIYVAVSAANNCSYCVHSHTAAARAKGMSADLLAVLLQVVALANHSNALANAMQVEVDERFKA
jgi:uncharacterized peroxidase-related enzyme